MRKSKNTLPTLARDLCRILERIFPPPTISKVTNKKFIFVLEKV
jgi:hypothetical protein